MNSALDPGQLRGAGLDLPGRQPLARPRLRAARLRRDDPAGHPLLRPLRAVDGLRGLPPVADEGGLRPDRRQPAGGGARASSGAAGSSPRRRSSSSLVAGSFAFADIVLIKALGVGHGHRRGARRDRRAGAAGAGHDAPARATGTGGCPGASSGSSPRGCRSSRARRSSRSPRSPWPACCSSRPARRAGACWASIPSRRLSPPSTPAPPVAVADPRADPVPARRRAARPAHRVVVLHRPPAGRGRAALRLRVRDLPGRARRLPGQLGLAPGAHR